MDDQANAALRANSQDRARLESHIENRLHRFRDVNWRKADTATRQPSPTVTRSTGDPVERIARLARLRDRGVLSSEELEAPKRELLERL